MIGRLPLCLLISCGLDEGTSQGTPGKTPTDSPPTEPTVPPAAEGCAVSLDTEPFGPQLGALQPLDVDDVDVFELRGDVQYGRLGHAILVPGDVDADGFDDLVVGSAFLNEVYVVYGNQISSGEIGDLSGTVLTGAPGQFGYALASAGDANGDGSADFWVGAVDSTGLGSASLISGGPPAGAGSVADHVIATIRDDAVGGGGGRVSEVGDMTGDGILDIALGSDYYADGAGAVRVFAGPFAGELTTADAHVEMVGVQPMDALWHAEAAGDLDGDGADDLLVVAAGAGNGNGAIYVLLGPLTAGEDVLSTAHARIEGADGELLGHGITSLGDIDGDGLDDFAIGAPYADQRAGRVYVFTHLPTGVVDVSTADILLRGESPSGRFGYTVACAGILNIGAKFEFIDPGSRGGAVYTLSSLQERGDQQMLDGNWLRKFTAARAGDQLGRIGAAGNLLGDGSGELVMAASHARGDSGAVYVVAGTL